MFKFFTNQSKTFSRSFDVYIHIIHAMITILLKADKCLKLLKVGTKSGTLLRSDGIELAQELISAEL